MYSTLTLQSINYTHLPLFFKTAKSKIHQTTVTFQISRHRFFLNI